MQETEAEAGGGGDAHASDAQKKASAPASNALSLPPTQPRLRQCEARQKRHALRIDRKFAEAAQCLSVTDGARILLQLSLRGRNLYFGEAVKIVLMAWPRAASGQDGGSGLESAQRRNGSSISPSGACLTGLEPRRDGGDGGDGGHTSSMHERQDEDLDSICLEMCLMTAECGSRRLVATCPAPYG